MKYARDAGVRGAGARDTLGRRSPRPAFASRTPRFYLRAETIPLILGVIVGLMGVGLLLDAQLPDNTVVKRERRRRKRIERSRGGEMLSGLAMLAFAAALIGRDTWRYRILAVIVGTVLLILGAWANRAFIREAIVNRGPLRRTPAPDER
jgi:hypothetical protein